MRLSAPTCHLKTPESWIESLQDAGFTAGCAPLSPEDGDDVIEAYRAAAKKAGIIIAEVGAWSNPISGDQAKAAAAITKCQQHLELAEKLGARCCVNITGSRNPEQWDGPHPGNFSDETFDMIVQTTRIIVDAVRPKRTFYTLETMPWIFPSSPDEYLALLKAIDRPAVAVHLDPVNMINSPARAYRTGDFIRECFAKLGPHIKSCHAKDIILREQLTVHLDECRPGTGLLDYAVFLKELSRLDRDTTLMLEHMAMEEYPIAADYIRGVAKANELELM